MKTNLLKFSFLVVFGIMSMVSFSKGTIQGTVVDAESNESLVGVMVILKGTITGVSTNLDGSFALRVQTGRV